MKIGNRHTVGEIALFLGGTVVGNEQQIVTGLNVLQRAEPGDLVFADQPETFDEAVRSAAGVVLANREIALPEGKALILSATPFDDYNKLTRKFAPYRPQMSLTGEDCIIADTAHLSPNCFIGHDVTIGEHVTIHPGAYIGDGTVIEDYAIIGPNAVIGHYAFDYQQQEKGYARMHSCGYVHIGQYAEIGALATVDAGVSSVTRIGAGTKVDNQVHVAHDALIGDRCLLGAGVRIAAFALIKSDSDIAPGTVIHA